MPSPTNLLDGIPASLPEELFTTLLEAGPVRIERIVSRGHASADGFWYDQQQTEWVLVLQGAGRLQFEGQPQPVEMQPGDWITIPARCRHRVEWTDPDAATIWLAVHVADRAGEAAGRGAVSAE